MVPLAGYKIGSTLNKPTVISTQLRIMHRVIVTLLLLLVLWSLVTGAGAITFQDFKTAHDYLVKVYKLYQFIWE